MTVTHTHSQFRAPRGYSLVEATCVLGILAGAFVAILTILNYIGNGVYFDTVYADQVTRSTGTLYGIVAEVRDATAYSPNFFIEVNPNNPPKIVFDKVDSVDANGNVVWGSKVTYRLEQSTDPASIQFASDYPGIVPGRVVREEDFTTPGQAPAIFVVEERVPYQFKQNGVTTWGFNVTRNGSALAVTVSRFGTTPIDTGASLASVQTAQTLSNSSAPTASNLQGAIVISTATGTYFLRNPKLVIPAE